VRSYDSVDVTQKSLDYMTLLRFYPILYPIYPF